MAQFDSRGTRAYHEFMTLNELECGSGGVINKVDGQGALRDRLLDMGLTPGTEVYLRKTAPMGDPIEITLRGYELTLRKDDAKMIHLNGVKDVS
jgi:Fe2+ transport system protein FeoA